MLKLEINLYKYYSSYYLILGPEVVYYANNFGFGHSPNKFNYRPIREIF